MDREELDKQLEQNGRKIQLNKDDKSSGRKKLFALAGKYCGILQPDVPANS